MFRPRLSRFSIRCRGIPTDGLSRARRNLRSADLDAADVEVDLAAIPLLRVADADIQDAAELFIAGAAPKVWVKANPSAGRPRAYIAKAPGKLGGADRPLAAAACECVTEHMLAVIG